MAMTPPGFLRPRQTAGLSAQEEASLAAVCPALGQSVEAAGRTDDDLWGPYVRAETGWATDPAVRHAGSSGAGLTAILSHLVASGAVDAVVQTGSSADVPVANATVISTGPDDILTAAGSRYAPSAPLAGLHRLIGDGRRYAFVGKPCDAAALRAWSDREAPVRDSFPVILSFFCAGVPSQTGAELVLKALGTSLPETKSFRYRGNGWPGRATATLKDGSERSMTYHDSWGKILSKHVQHRCKICADGTGVAADIVCADAWEADDDGYPRFEEADGISLILSRTPLGADIVDAARVAGVVVTESFDIGGLAAIQPGQRERRRALLARLAALRLLGRPVPRYRGLHIWAAARQNPVKRNLKNFLGMARRAIRGRF